MKYDVKYSKGYLIGLFCITVFLIAGTIFITNSFISTGLISSALLQDAKHPNWFYVVMSAIISIVDIILTIVFVAYLRFKITIEDNIITVRKHFQLKNTTLQTSILFTKVIIHTEEVTHCILQCILQHHKNLKAFPLTRK